MANSMWESGAEVRTMVWDSPSTLFVAKTATPAEGNWAGFWGTREKIPGEFVVACGDCAKVFGFVAEALDEVAFSVKRGPFYRWWLQLFLRKLATDVGYAHQSSEKFRCLSKGRPLSTRRVSKTWFSPEETVRLSVAYEATMAILRIPNDDGPLALIVAKKIIDIYGIGEWNATQLAARALRELVGPDAGGCSDKTDGTARLRAAPNTRRRLK
jgi:hypothetical protein